MKKVASRTATIPTTPSFSSDQASDRVRGMTAPLRVPVPSRGSGEKRAQIRIRGRPQFGRRPFERDATVLEHQKLRARLLVVRDLLERDGCAIDGHVLRDEEGIT